MTERSDPDGESPEAGGDGPAGAERPPDEQVRQVLRAQAEQRWYRFEPDRLGGTTG